MSASSGSITFAVGGPFDKALSSWAWYLNACDGTSQVCSWPPEVESVAFVTKKLIWIGFFVGSSVGGFVPALWGSDVISLSGFLWSVIGGLAGMWIGYRAAQQL